MIYDFSFGIHFGAALWGLGQPYGDRERSWPMFGWVPPLSQTPGTPALAVPRDPNPFKPKLTNEAAMVRCAYSFATAAGLGLSRLQSEPGEERAILAPPPPTTTTTATTTTTTTRTRTGTTRKTRSRPFRTHVFCHFSFDLPTFTVSFLSAIGICMVSLLIFATNHFHEK